MYAYGRLPKKFTFSINITHKWPTVPESVFCIVQQRKKLIVCHAKGVKNILTFNFVKNINSSNQELNTVITVIRWVAEY